MSEVTVVSGGFVCDGSGSDPVRKDLLIRGGKIEDVADPGAFRDADALSIDAAGRLVSPGFIDAHSHGEKLKVQFPENRSKLLQGVTTEVDGNCGFSAGCVPGEQSGKSWQDLTGYLQILKDHPVSTNTVVLAGHNDIRRFVMRSNARPAGAEEIRSMQKILEDAFACGAAGWSAGLTYFPGKFADTAELKALSAVTGGSRKIYAVHMRSEGDQLLESVAESAEVARAGSGRLQISHLKTIFPRNYHKIDAVLALLDQLIASGMDLHADRYPYVYSSTWIGQTLPEPYCKMPDIMYRLRESAEFREKVEEALKSSPRDLATTILTARGKTLAAIAAGENKTLEQVCAEAIMADSEQNAAFLCMSEENLERILRQPYVCAGSDALSAPLDDELDKGHPRSAGTFPEFFKRVSASCGIGEAIRRMTSLPASVFRIPERGLLRKGFAADLVIFDPGRFSSAADFSTEDWHPSGVERVMIAGKTAWCDKEPEKVCCAGAFIPVG